MLKILIYRAKRRRTDAEIEQIMGDKDFQKVTKPFDTMAHFTDIIQQNITGLLDPFIFCRIIS